MQPQLFVTLRCPSLVRRFAALLLITSLLLGTAYAAFLPSVAYASCAAPKEEIAGSWVNIQDVVGGGAILHQISFGRGCPDVILCDENGNCDVAGSSGWGAQLNYECDNPNGCTWHNPLSVDPSGRQAWLSGPMGHGTFSMSAYLTQGRYGFTQLTIEWSMDFPEQSSYADFSQIEYFIRQNESTAYLDADDAANYVPRPTATPWPTPTPTPQPTRVIQPFHTVQPGNGACLTQGAQFEWGYDIGLPAGHYTRSWFGGPAKTP